MKDQKLTLALSFIQEEPGAAAKILEQTDLESVANFLLTIPINYSTLLIKNLIPAFSTRLCLQLGPQDSSALLSNLDVSTITKIVRLMKKDDRNSFLDCIQDNKHKACELLLKFSLETVGAWMVPHTSVLTRDFKTKDVKKYLKSAKEEFASEYIYIVDREGKLEGRVSYPSLLAAAPDSIIGELVKSKPPHVSFNMLLQLSSELEDWQHTDVLAVVDTHDQLLGLLRHSDLKKGLSQLKQNEFIEPSGLDPISGIFDVYGQSLLVLLNTVSNTIEADLKS